jgi:hypothetical protein
MVLMLLCRPSGKVHLRLSQRVPDKAAVQAEDSKVEEVEMVVLEAEEMAAEVDQAGVVVHNPRR